MELREGIIAFIGVLFALWNGWVMYALREISHRIDRMDSKIDDDHGTHLLEITNKLAVVTEIRRKMHEMAVTHSAAREKINALSDVVSNGLQKEIKGIAKNLAELQGRCAAYTGGIKPPYASNKE